MDHFAGKTYAFLGRSGCGKGTQFELLQEYLEKEGYSVLRHGSGDALREIAAQDTVAGNKVKEVLANGGLLPGWLASFTWERTLVEKLDSMDRVLLLDGSPRRLEEAKRLDAVLEWMGREPLVPVHVDVPEDVIVERLLLRGRGDDTEAVIRSRLAWYENDVVPILEYYRASGRLITVDGHASVEEVAQKIQDSLSATVIQ